MSNDLIYKKIIPCLDLNNALDMAKYYIKKYKDALVNERNLVYPE